MMKIVKEHINEKFAEHSDPISDMGIGGIVLKKEFNQLQKDLAIKWTTFLRKFKGKRVKGNMHPHYPNEPKSQMTTGIIQKVLIKISDNNIIQNADIHLVDEEGIRYYIDEDEKIYIIDENS